MRSSRWWKNRCLSPILSLLLVFVGDVLEVAQAFLQLAFALVGEPFRLLLAVAGQRSKLFAHLAGDVLHMAFGLVLVHKRSCHGRKCPPQPEQGSCLRRPGRPLGLARDLPSRRVEVGPGRRALRPDVRGDPQGRRIVERAGTHADHLRQRFAVAIERRAAVAAEVAKERAAAVGLLGVALRRALHDPEVLAPHERHHGAVRAGGALAIGAVALAQLAERCADGVADGAAQAAAGMSHDSLLLRGAATIRQCGASWCSSYWPRRARGRSPIRRSRCGSWSASRPAAARTSSRGFWRRSSASAGTRRSSSRTSLAPPAISRPRRSRAARRTATRSS